MEENIIVLTDENGVDTKVEVIEVIEYQGNHYAFVAPVMEDSDEAWILEIKEDETGEFLAPVEDDDVFDAVCDLFAQRNEDEYELLS